MELLSKSRLMQHVKSGTAHECFTHSDAGTFDITAMRAARDVKRMTQVKLSDIVPFIRATRVIDTSRVDELTEHEAMYDTALVVRYMLPDGREEHLYIDGHHRALKLDKMGKLYQCVHMVEESEIIRPGYGWERNPNLDWGDDLVDGKIVKRVAE